MAKPIIPASAPSTVAASAVAASAVAEPATLSKADKQALFAVPRSIDAEVTALEASIVQANDRKSASIKAIEDACGNGPFSLKGEIVRISSRTMKDGKTVHFFKGQGKSDVEKID